MIPSFAARSAESERMDSEAASATCLDDLAFVNRLTMVHHPTVTRGQLATPLEITVTRPGGFSEPIVLSITADYLSLFLNQGPDPDPSAETATADDLILTFDPPPGDTFVVGWNLQAKAVGSFTTANAHIALLDSIGQSLVSVDFDTKVRP